MTEIIWAVPEDKRKLFDNEYSKMIQGTPKEFWEGKNYMPVWYSELPFPQFWNNFIHDLPNEYRQKIKDLYNSIIVGEN